MIVDGMMGPSEEKDVNFKFYVRIREFVGIPSDKCLAFALL